jgi:hypothetical protein
MDVVNASALPRPLRLVRSEYGLHPRARHTQAASALQSRPADANNDHARGGAKAVDLDSVDPRRSY